MIAFPFNREETLQFIYTSLIALLLCCALESKLVDCHLSNPGEEWALEQEMKELRNERNLEIIHDEKASDMEKVQAYEQLIKDEGLS